MAHSFTQIWLHVVFATKDRQPLIEANIEKDIYQYLSKQLQDQGCYLKIGNGMPDHVHLLFTLNPQKAIIDVVKQAKGASSHWVNDALYPSAAIKNHFGWQTGYSAFSVSESQVGKVYDYIKNQKAHHAKRTFQEEYEGFLQLHGINQQS
jgi:putative transposase